MVNKVIVLESEPGIQRDGTFYDSKNYIDGQWVRFYRNRPRKIGGYRIIDNGIGGTDGIIRTIYNYDNPSTSNSCDSYLGRAASVGYETFDFNGVGGGFIDRTPDLTSPTNYYYPNNLWDFDVFIPVDAPDDPQIVAHVAPNAVDIGNDTEGPIYYGATTGVDKNAVLTQVVDANNEPVLASGGIVFAAPILVAYGNGGMIRWSHTGDITSDWPAPEDGNTQTIANTKILKMSVARGSSAPQLLAWTLNSIISLTYDSDTTTGKTSFIAVPIDSSITVISPGSIVGYNNQFFWIGMNQFYFFNGIVNTLPNTMNAEFFFDNVNLQQRGKIFGEIIRPTIGVTEIWWHYPTGTSTECDHVIIYNITTGKWYDSNLNRAAAASSGTFPFPMMSDNQLVNIPTRSGVIQVYPLWMHEFGYDQIFSLPTNPPSPPTNIQAIDSYFETHIYDFFESNPNINRAMRNLRIEPDLEMNGNMTITVRNRFFPADSINGELQIKGPYTFDMDTQKIDAVTSQGRLVSFKFESNELGGRYQMGKTLLNYNIGDGRTSGSGNAGTGG